MGGEGRGVVGERRGVGEMVGEGSGRNGRGGKGSGRNGRGGKGSGRGVEGSGVGGMAGEGRGVREGERSGSVGKQDGQQKVSERSPTARTVLMQSRSLLCRAVVLVNPFTAPACKISGLKSADIILLQTAYFHGPVPD